MCACFFFALKKEKALPTALRLRLRALLFLSILRKRPANNICLLFFCTFWLKYVI
jgi:hypothetical protein